MTTNDYKLLDTKKLKKMGIPAVVAQALVAAENYGITAGELECAQNEGIPWEDGEKQLKGRERLLNKLLKEVAAHGRNH